MNYCFFFFSARCLNEEAVIFDAPAELVDDFVACEGVEEVNELPALRP